MVNFAELKAKAEKVKDAGVTKVTNTRDRLSSTPSSKTSWDPNWKRAPPPPVAAPRASTGVPPPPLRGQPNVAASGVSAPPMAPRASRPAGDPSPYTPPPSRAVSGYPPSHREPPDGVAIDWANLSGEDKEAFFGWLDEFFSRHLGIELSPRERRSESKPPPMVNMSTRPPM